MFCSDIFLFGEFDLDHQRWLPVAELSLPEDKTDQVSAVAWAPNIGRPYELIAVATQKGISIWHLGSNPDADGRLSAQKLATLAGHDSECGRWNGHEWNDACYYWKRWRVSGCGNLT
ncbi:UNVERIFIED_CONTAM: protein SEH1 [Sesamum radiatum]|uniref:Protein SEH1 n=1 Tax=Sesamum radiatum TaxID=300843 RepID=A0AAW2ILW2_SESRA